MARESAEGDPPAPREVPAAQRRATQAFSLVMLLIGLALLVRTLAAGGGALAQGVILGVLFVAAGAGRLWISRSG